VGEGLINAHLDSCLSRSGGGGGGGGGQGGEPGAPHGPPAQPRLPPPAPAASRRPLPVPPKLILSIVKDKELRDRLRAYGLPTAGKRAVRGHRFLFSFFLSLPLVPLSPPTS
jgi:hypothetical protein